MTKQDKPWVVEEKTNMGMLPESSHSSLTKVLASFPKRLSGVREFTVKAGKKVWMVHKEVNHDNTSR